MNRRGFITGMAVLIAAPAIVRATSIMPVAEPMLRLFGWHTAFWRDNDTALDVYAGLLEHYTNSPRGYGFPFFSANDVPRKLSEVSRSLGAKVNFLGEPEPGSPDLIALRLGSMHKVVYSTEE